MDFSTKKLGLREYRGWSEVGIGKGALWGLMWACMRLWKGGASMFRLFLSFFYGREGGGEGGVAVEGYTVRF